MPIKSKPFWFVLIVAILISWGCGMSTSQKLSNASSESTKTAGESTTQPGKPENSASAPSNKPAEPTATLKPTEAPKPPVKDLNLHDVAYIQDGESVVPVFFIDNPNENFAVENAQYQVSLLDAAGTVLKSDEGYVTILMPGEKSAVARDIYIEKGQTVARVDVQITQGTPNWIDQPVKVFETEKAAFYPDQNFPRATGIIKNGLKNNLTNVLVTAISFDEGNKVVGAGYTYVNFVPGSSQTGVSLAMKVGSGTVAKTELYPALSGLSDTQESVSDSSPLTVAESGFGQDSSHLGVGYFLQNSDTKSAVESSMVRAVAYDETGNVLGAEEATIEIVLPGEKLGTFLDIYVPENNTVAKVDVQLLPGKATSINFAGPVFKTDQVTFLPDQYFPKASGVILNGLNQNVERLRVSTIAYNADGKIIGGGFTFLDFLAPNGQSPVDMTIVAAEPPAKVEIYPTLSSLSVLENLDVAASPVQLISQGYSQGSALVGIGFVVKNSDPKNTYSGSQYQVAAFDETGKVLGTTSGYLADIYPNTQIGGYAEFGVPDNSKVAKIDVQINPGRPDSPQIPQNPFTFENVNFAPDTYFSKVTGIIKNSYEKQITNAGVIAIAYDDQGAIIGGGYTFVDFVPGNGQSAVEMSVRVTGTPAKWELYGSLTSLSEIK